MRINQLVAAGSSLSRRAADTAIVAGRVTIGGHTAALGETVTEPGSILLDGQPLKLPPTATYIMLHKPADYISSRTRQGPAPTLYELLPPHLRNLRPAGRLDRDSSGLILLASDGDFIHRYTHPSFDKTKIYELTLTRPLNQAAQHQLEAGVELTDGPSHVKVISAKAGQVTVGLTEGRNRQLRRTFGALGYTIKRLHRTHIGPYALGDLPSGAWQEVAPK